MADSKPLLAALRGETTWPPPVWLMRQAGRYLPEYRAVRAGAPTFLDLCYNPDLAVEVTLQPLRRFPLDAAILFSDILVVPDALGVKVGFVEGEGPKLEAISRRSEIEALDEGAIEGHLGPVFETLRRLRGCLPAATTLIGFSGAPFTLAAYMIEGGSSADFGKALRLAREDSGLFATLIERLSDAIVHYCSLQIDAGAEVIQLFDSWAGALEPSGRRDFCLRPLARIAGELNARHPNVPVIAFPRGVGPQYREFARDLPVQGLSLDQFTSPRWAARHLREKGLCLQGNLDPEALLGPVDAMLEEADEIVAAWAAGPFIFNLGHGVQPATNPDRVAILVEHLKSRPQCATR